VVCRSAYHGDIAAAQLAAFQGASELPTPKSPAKFRRRSLTNQKGSALIGKRNGAKDLDDRLDGGQLIL
jgi:hypothetical protein